MPRPRLARQGSPGGGDPAADPSPLAGLGIREIVDHYDRIVRSSTSPRPHRPSFGGLFVRLLLDRGLGAAGSRSIGGAEGRLRLRADDARVAGPVLLIPFGWRKVVPGATAVSIRLRPHNAGRRAAGDLGSPDRADSGRPFFEAGFSVLDRDSPVRLDFWNPDRAPSCSSRAMRTGQYRRPSSDGCSAPIGPRPHGRTSSHSPAGRTGSSPRTAGRRSPKPASTGSRQFLPSRRLA